MISDLARWFPEEELSPGLIVYLSAVGEIRIDPACRTIGTMFGAERLTCIISPRINEWSLDARLEALRHECDHLVRHHHPRGLAMLKQLGQLDTEAWNVVCDASINHMNPAAIKSLNEICPPITFELLKMPPCPPEVAYMKLPTRVVDGGSCGREHVSGQDEASGTLATLVATLILAAEPERFAQVGHKGGREASSRSPFDGVLPEAPPWARRVIAYLTETDMDDGRERSWRRENRRLPGVLPGLMPEMARAAVFIVDGSGSVPRDDIRLALSAFANTPELRHSAVVVFDTVAHPPIPIIELDTIMAALEKTGGGTHFAPPAALRHPDCVAIWITDGETGDGWPTPHPAGDVWVVTGNIVPPYGVLIHAEDDAP